MPRSTSRIGRDSPLDFRYSVRLWLPLLLGAVVVLGLGTILIATHREVENTLLGAASERAEEAASRIAALIYQGTVGEREAVRADPVPQDFLVDPTPEHRAAVEAAYAPSAPFRRVELWDANATLMLEMATPDTYSTRVPRFLPVGAPPREEAVSVLRESAGRFYLDVVTEVRAGPAPEAPRAGWIREYGTLSLTGIELRELLGTGGDLRLGSLEGGVWTNLTTVTPPPVRRTDAGEVEQVLEEEWVDATVVVAGTPLMVWAGFPRDLVVAPATSFTRRTTLLSLLFLAGGVLVPLLIAMYLTEPLHALTRAAGQIAAGDYSRRVRVQRRDEIGKLSDAFNTMAEEVEDAYATLRRQHDETHFALGAARIGIWEADLRTKLVACSPSLADVFGIEEAALPKTRGELLALLHPEDRDRLRPYLEDDVSGPDTFDIDCRAIDERAGVRWIEGKGQIRRDANGRPPTVFGVFMDVTDRRQLEEQLRQSQKMEAIGQLAGGVAHDFNNLLTSIVSHGSLLSEQLPENTPEHEDVMAILQAGESAAALTRQLLTFSRRQVIHPQRVDVIEVVGNAQKLLRRLIPEDIDVVVRSDPDLPAIMIDPGELEQVIMNLAINARDAMTVGGVLRLSTESRRTEDPVG
ncbi:MAG: HAMP domain-containing protein, partial [Gemmatimonadota bacterium]